MQFVLLLLCLIELFSVITKVKKLRVDFSAIKYLRLYNSCSSCCLDMLPPPLDALGCMFHYEPRCENTGLRGF